MATLAARKPPFQTTKRRGTHMSVVHVSRSFRICSVSLGLALAVAGTAAAEDTRAWTISKGSATVVCHYCYRSNVFRVTAASPPS